MLSMSFLNAPIIRETMLIYILVHSLVAVHGLGGHREKTWTAKNGAFWLRDYLPIVVPNARILTYGYDGTSSSSQSLHDHAVDLITNLTQLRETTAVSLESLVEEFILIVFLDHQAANYFHCV